MVAGERADPVRAEEFVLVEHARQNPAQPFLIHQRSDATLAIPEMAGPGGMNALRSSGMRCKRSLRSLQHSWNPFALPWLDDGRGTEG